MASRIRAERENHEYLPGVMLNDRIGVTDDMEEALYGSELVISAVPSHTVRDIYRRMLPHLKPEMILVSASKGLENETLMRMSEVIADVTCSRFAPNVVALSGPSFAAEVARGDPTALVAASTDERTAKLVQRALSGLNVRVYTNCDLIGVEIGGAVKNVIAIAAGVITGLGLGSNTVAGLITRGLAEIKRLAVIMGGRPETLAGLAGLGDLVLTCTGALSRNRSVGIKLGHGLKLDEIIAEMKMVAEGVKTTRSALALARKLGVEMPITEQMYAVLYQGKAPQLAIRELMERELKGE